MSDEKYEIYEEPTWIIHDPWEARDIAVFHDKDRADQYLATLNNDFDPEEPLTNRIVLAALNSTRDGDPTLTIGIGETEVRISWAPQYCIRCGTPHDKEGKCGRDNQPA